MVDRVATSLVLLSGGLDSATALAAAARESVSPGALFLMYGQTAGREERQAAVAIADHYSVSLETLTVTGPPFRRRRDPRAQRLPHPQRSSLAAIVGRTSAAGRFLRDTAQAVGPGSDV